MKKEEEQKKEELERERFLTSFEGFSRFIVMKSRRH